MTIDIVQRLFCKRSTKRWPLIKILFKFVIFQSILIGIAIGISIRKVCVYLKVVAFAITLISFTCSIFIGGAIQTRLADQFLLILIYFVVIYTVFVAAATAFYVLNRPVCERVKLFYYQATHCWYDHVFMRIHQRNYYYTMIGFFYDLNIW